MPTDHEYPTRCSVTAVEATAEVVDATGAVLPAGIIDGGEVVILAIKSSVLRPLFDSAPWLGACAFAAGCAMWSGRIVPSVSLAVTLQLVLLLAMIRVGTALVRWLPAWYVLTNRRILSVRGVRRPRVTARMLVEIRNTYLRHTTAERVTRLGTIIFATDRSDDAPTTWRSIQDSKRVHAEIRRAIEQALDHHSHTV